MYLRSSDIYNVLIKGAVGRQYEQFQTHRMKWVPDTQLYTDLHNGKLFIRLTNWVQSTSVMTVYTNDSLFLY